MRWLEPTKSFDPACASLGLIVNQMVHQMQAAHAKEVQAYKVQIAELRRWTGFSVEIEVKTAYDMSDRAWHSFECRV